MLNLIIILAASFMSGIAAGAMFTSFQETGRFSRLLISILGVAEIAGLSYFAGTQL